MNLFDIFVRVAYCPPLSPNFPPQEELILGNRGNSTAESGSKPRIRGRKVGTSFPAGHQDRPYSAPPVAFPAAKTTEDPYVQATLKRSIVELYNTCHRLLSFKVCDRVPLAVPFETYSFSKFMRIRSLLTA